MQLIVCFFLYICYMKIIILIIGFIFGFLVNEFRWKKKATPKYTPKGSGGAGTGTGKPTVREN